MSDMSEIKKTLIELMQSIDGLQAIVISDRDGVVLVKASTESCPDLALRTNFLSVFGNASEQAGKLGMGRNNRIISMYQNLQVIQISKLPIVITLVARNTANTGYLLTLEETLDPLVQSLRSEVNSLEI